MVTVVTGCAGFIGSNLSKKLIELGHYVIGIDNLSTGYVKNIADLDENRFEFHIRDVNEDISDILPSHIDYIYHYAACVGVKRTIDNPLDVLKDIKGIENMLKIAVTYNVSRFFFSSSSEVYGEPVEIPQNEVTTPLNARLPYAIVKSLGEVYIKAYNKEFGVPYTIFRFFNTYGRNQSEDFVVSKFIKSAKENKDITVYGDGLQTRTFMHISDNIEATTKAIDNEDSNGLVINIGNNTQTTIKELAQTIIDLINSNSKIIHLPPLAEGDMTRRQPDNSLMKSLLLTQTIPLNEGLKLTI